MPLKYVNRLVIAGLSATGLLCAEAALSPADAAQQFSCTGSMNNGWNYTAEFVDGRFTQIRWQRSGQPPQVSQLTFDTVNAQGQPIYRGSFQAATAVTLIDLSKGDVRTGSQVSVGVEEWGWSRGSCGTSSSGGGTGGGGTTGGGSGASTPTPVVRQQLVGSDGATARTWLRQNDFFFTNTVEHTNTRTIERWNRDFASAVDVVIVNDVVVNVVDAPGGGTR